MELYESHLIAALYESHLIAALRCGGQVQVQVKFEIQEIQ